MNTQSKEILFTLRAARINKGLTQAEAAEEIGVTEDTIRNYEKGKSFPDIPTLKRIEDVYGVPYNMLNFCPKITV